MKRFSSHRFRVTCSLLGILLFHVVLSGNPEEAGGSQKDFPFKSTGQLFFDADVFQYQGRENRTKIEVVYSLNGKQLKRYLSPADSVCVLEIVLKLWDQNNQLIHTFNEEKSIKYPRSDTAAGDFVFMDLKRFEVVPETYKIELTIKESTSGIRGRLDEILTVKDFGHIFSISDLYFISHLQKGDQKNLFEKNGLILIPNVSRVFFVKKENRKGYLYYELNHLLYDSNADSYYATQLSIIDLSGHEVASETKSSILKKGSQSARIEVIPLSDLETGIYKLELSVNDYARGKTIQQSRYFQVNSDLSQKSTVLPMSDDDVEKYLDQIQYIASDEEINVYKELNPKGKQQFLIHFWQSRDPIPETSENEFMIEHFQRMAYAEANFNKGIHSDMGRIYIQYGPPLDIQREFSNMEYSKPITIWTYAKDGRIEFVFADRSGDGNYVLVHSTQVDEYSNPNWMQQFLINQ